MKPELLESLKEALHNTTHCRLLDMQVKSAENGKLSLVLPYNVMIIGDTDTGVVDGGALTTLMDSCCAFAASTAEGDIAMTPTLDLRIDYMKPAEPGVDIIGEAEAYRISNSVIFARGIAYQEGDKDNPVAHCSASFMRLDPSKVRKAGK